MTLSNVSLKKIACRLSAGIAVIALAANSSSALAQKTGGEDDFTLTFTLPEESPLYFGEFDRGIDYVGYTVTGLDDNYMDSGVGYYLLTYGDGVTHDMGFFDRDTQFCLTGYAGGKSLYVADIEVEWSYEQECGGSLLVYSRSELQGAFPAEKSYATMLSGATEEGRLVPTVTETPGISKLSFEVRPSYIAFVWNSGPQNLAFLSRFKQFSIHFSTLPESDNLTNVVNSMAIPGDDMPEYYDLQGLRIPEKSLGKGIYLKRVGSKVEKILL